MPDTFACPHCGADVPVGALACPACGSDEETGWSDQAGYAHLLIYDDDEEASPTPPGPDRPWRRYAVAAIAVIVASALVASSSPWGIYALPIALAIIALLYYRNQVRSGQGGGREKHLYQELLMRARGDEALVERLVAYERKRNPGAVRGQLLEAALFRWERDNR